MSNFSIIKYLPRSIAVKKKDLSNFTSKIYKTAGSIGFIKKALYHEVTPKFVQVQANFNKKNNKYKAEKSILLSHLNGHVCRLKSLCKKHYSFCTELFKVLYLVIINHINVLQYKDRLVKIRNKKLKKLIQNNTPVSKYKVPDTERKELEMGLEYSFVDKNKRLKQQLAVNMETVSHSATKYVEDNKVEDFYELLRAYTDIFEKNIYATKDFFNKNLKNMINNDKLAVVSGDKDSCVIIMTREDYN